MLPATRLTNIHASSVTTAIATPKRTERGKALPRILIRSAYSRQSVDQPVDQMPGQDGDDQRLEDPVGDHQEIGDERDQEGCSSVGLEVPLRVVCGPRQSRAALGSTLVYLATMRVRQWIHGISYLTAASCGLTSDPGPERLRQCRHVSSVGADRQPRFPSGCRLCLWLPAARSSAPAPG